MRPVRRLLLVLGAASTLALTLLGQSVRVLGVSGEATAQAPGESTPRPLRVGDTIVVGTRIVTAEGARVVLTPLPGVKSIVAPASDVLIERVGDETAAIREATLDLRTGAITSDLQRAEGVTLDYRIRTARGVAGARGTTYTVAINAAGIQTVVVSHGLITLSLADGRVVELSPGQISITRPDGATKTVSRAADLDETERAEAGEWMAATLDSLAEAAEQDIDLQVDALENAAAAAESLGLDLDDRTARALERARRVIERQREREEQPSEREASRTLQELLEDKTGTDDSMDDPADDEVVKDEREVDDDDSPSTPDDPLASFLAGLSADRLAAYAALSGDERRAFALLPTDALRLLVLDVNDDDFNDFALELTPAGTLRQNSAALRYVGELPAAQRRGFFRLNADTQNLLLARAADTTLKTYALTIDGEGDPRADFLVVFFADLNAGQRARFAALSDRLQTDLAEINQPALTAFALGTTATPDQIAYLVALDSADRAALLALPTGVLDLLFAHPGDDDLREFVLAESPSLATATFYAGLSARQRERFHEDLSADQRTLAVADPTFAGLVFDAGEGDWINSLEVLAHYAALSGARADYAARPAALRVALADYDRPAFTEALLDPATFGDGLAPTDTQLGYALDALLGLSSQHRALFETLAGGPTYAQLGAAPHPAEWSADAFQRTANTFASLSATQREQLIGLGAAEAVMDRSGTYLEAALADFNTLPAATRAALVQAGWGRHFDAYFADEKVRAALAAAADLTATELATAAHFGITPAGLLANEPLGASPVALVDEPATVDTTLRTTARANLTTLAGLPAADRALLASLDLGDELIAQNYRYDPTTATQVGFSGIVADVLDFARRLGSDDLLALRQMGATRWLLDYRADEKPNGSDATALAGARALVATYQTLPASLRETARDTGLFGRVYLPHPPSATDLVGALQAVEALSPATRAYLATEGREVDLLAMHLHGGAADSNVRSLFDFDSLVSRLNTNELGLLRDLDAAVSLAGTTRLPAGLEAAMNAIDTVLDAVKRLSDTQRFALRELGIVGPEATHQGIFRADPAGLARLLADYAALDGSLRAGTRQLSPLDGYRAVQGDGFFFSADPDNSVTTYDISFVATGDLRVGSTRRLALSGKNAQIGVTFSVPAGKDLHLRASDLIDLENVSVSAGVRAITMAAVTINLSNFDFPEGSVAALTSRDGDLRFGSDARVGSVNFKSNVTYGGELMFDHASFHSASRDNIAIGSFDTPAQLPAFKPKLTTTGGNITE